MKNAVALSIAGSDSGGGAGIQADLAAFSYFGVFGTTAVTAITAQNPNRVSAVVPIPPDFVKAQMEAVLGCFSVGAAKTGMLFSAAIIRAVSQTLHKHPGVPLVVDPVMVATSGARLLEEDAIDALMTEILPRAALITPNIPEACLLMGCRNDIPECDTTTAYDLSRELHRKFNVPVLLKGGHGKGKTATDILCTDTRLTTFEALRETAPTTHGTGCSLSAAVAANIAQGRSLEDAVLHGKAYVLGRLRSAIPVGIEAWALAPPDVLPLETVMVQHL